jgi:hypothetical protein
MYNNIYNEILKHTHIYKQRSFIKNRIDKHLISRNKNGCYFIERHMESINKCLLFENENAYYICEYIYSNMNNTDFINYFSPHICENSSDEAYNFAVKYNKLDFIFTSLNKNENFLKLLEKNPSKINWKFLSSNSADYAIKILKDNIEIVFEMKHILSNKNPKIYDIIKILLEKHNLSEQNFFKDYFYIIVLNSNPIFKEFIKDNIDKSDSDYKSLLNNNCNDEIVSLLIDKYETYVNDVLSSNSSDIAINYLLKNPHKIDWYNVLSNKNPRSIKLLKLVKNQIEYSSYLLQINPHIFKISKLF